MFLMDDSGSMDWEILTSESSGVFDDGEANCYYVFDDPNDDNNYQTGSNSRILEGNYRGKWKAQWHGYNRMYYNPTVDYDPWPGKENADSTTPLQDPMNAATLFDLTAVYHTIPPGNAEIIIDDMGPGFSTTGSWHESQYTPEYADYSKYTNENSTATFTPTLPATGFYDVTAWWNCYTDRDQNAKITITHAAGSTVQYWNQRATNDHAPEPGVCGEWLPLGSFSFAAGTGGSVKIERHTASTGGSTIADAVKFTHEEPEIVIHNAHYYAQAGDSVYLVNFNAGAREFYLFSDQDQDSTVETGELTLLDAAQVPTALRQRAAADELQNFANWYSYYRRRELTAKGAIAEIIENIKGVSIGLYSIHERVNQAVLKVKVREGGVWHDNTETLINQVYNYYSANNTPLRNALQNVGRYLHADDGSTGGIGETPYYVNTDNGDCQQSFVIAMTDGYYNGDDPNVSNEDGDNGDPYADDYADTLADVAMKYYENDLSSALDDLVPGTYMDPANHQHMVTYGVSFGVYGTLNPDDYDLYNKNHDLRVYPTWPDPTAGDQQKVDDLWHATVNGRGEFLSAADPQELVDSLQEIMQSIVARVGTAASVSINGEELQAGLLMFQSSYATDGWTGDVKAYPIDEDTGAVDKTTVIWSAGELLGGDYTDWDTDRKVATYNGSSGIPFRYYSSLSEDQKAMLSEDETLGQQMLNYLRGDTSLEGQNGGAFRDRYSILGDVVHSEPLYHDGVIYAGSNAGMVHAFDKTTGMEIFAYVPALIFPNLVNLTNPEYAHRYYVDMTPYARDIDSGAYDGQTWLVGGLGKGGRGYYCLNVTDIATIDNETALASRVKWEYPRIGTNGADINDLGYSFSKAFILESDAGWIVIFGNGYNSPNGHAVLFVLDVETGTLLKKIDTGVGECNGLSTPTPVDVNNDYKVDYVYAGDLKGNIWKFDLRGSTATWGHAYAGPLFQARHFTIPQPITTPPDVMDHCDPTKPGYMVLFGTGKYLGESDFDDTSVQSLYGIWDYGDDDDNTEYLGYFARGQMPELSNQPESVTLLEQTEVFYQEMDQGGSTRFVRVLSQNAPSWETTEDDNPDQEPNPAAHAGWFFNLPISKERLIRRPMIRSGRFITITSIPNTSPCSAGGNSMLMEVDACHGGRNTYPWLDFDEDGKIDDNDLIEIGTDDQGEPIMAPPTGIHFTAMMYSPVILIDLNTNTETMYMSTATGNVPMIRQKAEPHGMFFWQEVDLQ